MIVSMEIEQVVDASFGVVIGGFASAGRDFDVPIIMSGIMGFLWRELSSLCAKVEVLLCDCN